MSDDFPQRLVGRNFGYLVLDPRENSRRACEVQEVTSRDLRSDSELQAIHADEPHGFSSGWSRRAKGRIRPVAGFEGLHQSRGTADTRTGWPCERQQSRWFSQSRSEVVP